MAIVRKAHGKPGSIPRWTSSCKSGVGTACTQSSPVWFTLNKGIVTEVFYPGPDQACIRDMQFVVADGKEYLSREEFDCETRIQQEYEGVPLYHIKNTSKMYVIEKRVFTDHRRPVLVQRISFFPSNFAQGSLHLYFILASHLCNHGYGNTAWVDEYKGVPMLFSQKENRVLALACSTGWKSRSVGFVDASDGCQELLSHKKIINEYQRAENGNVCLTGEINVPSNNEFFLSLAFGETPEEAANYARASLQENISDVQEEYVINWQNWQKSLLKLERVTHRKNIYRSSAMVLRSHESMNSGSIVASLSIPWGESKDDTLLKDYAYFLSWTRDLVQATGGLLAAGDHKMTRSILMYLQSAQEEDGHWPQNMWTNGSAARNGIQMDETALPILLTDLSYREKAIGEKERERLWPMVRDAAIYLLRNGPVTPEDRWEVDTGIMPFTIAAEIAALLVAAEQAERVGEHSLAKNFRSVADDWFSKIDKWIYVTDTEWCHKYGIKGYYARRTKEARSTNHLEIVSCDVLALVRFGLRHANDERIVDTVKLIDNLLKIETPKGPCWHRYTGDTYGEDAEGKPFKELSSGGKGRAWPLLTGERAHYELALGDKKTANQLLKALESFGSETALIPEQIWDTESIEDKNLFFAEASGSARPLVWAHAEHIKLLRSFRDKRIFDLPGQTVQRYLVERKFL